MLLLPLLVAVLSQVMHYAVSVEKKRVAVHCHAGLGRTGLTIACFLVACGEAATATQAVEMVRAARPGSLQTQAQVTFVSIFEQYLQHLR
jgi:protein tyrosine phosphatase domain-containing protein 1